MPHLQTDRMGLGIAESAPVDRNRTLHEIYVMAIH